MKERVILGMSGGVDSSVAVHLLQEAGYEVLGVTLRLLLGEQTDKSIEDAKRVAKDLEIGHVVLDESRRFKESVMDYFTGEYLNCRTPNPCVMCNKKIKWGLLLSACETYGCDYVATGHYAGIKRLENGRYSVIKGADPLKDQSYFLYTLSQKELSKTLFPLGDYTKEEIRNLAVKLGLSVSEKKDSQDICFIPEGDYKRVIKELVPDLKESFGDFVDEKGNVLGSHSGLINYTVGQRKNLGISLGKRAYVKSLNREKNQVILCDDKNLFGTRLIAGNINHMGEERFLEDVIYESKIRYSKETTPCKISYQGEDIVVEFLKPVRAITPGQSLVIYKDEAVAGGGIIREAL